MQITGRRKKIAFFLILGICLVAAAVALTGSWIILNWRERVLLFFGVVFFIAIITGLILNTSFLVREIRLNEYHDSFINAVTHELKTPITSIRLYLETLQRRDVDETQRQQFYKLMLDDTDRLRGTVEQVLKAGEVRYKHVARNPADLDFGSLVRECMELARTRHHLHARRAALARTRAASTAPKSRFTAIRTSSAPRFPTFSTTPSSTPAAKWTYRWESKRRTKSSSRCTCATAAWEFRRTS